jgi:hypothetical protein
VKLLGVSASLTRGGRTRAAVEFALGSVAGRFSGVETELLDFRDCAIAPCDGRPLEEYPGDTKRAVRTIQDAAACLIAPAAPGVVQRGNELTGARVRDDLRQLAEGVLLLAERLGGCRLGPPPLAARARG